MEKTESEKGNHAQLFSQLLSAVGIFVFIFEHGLRKFQVSFERIAEEELKITNQAALEAS